MSSSRLSICSYFCLCVICFFFILFFFKQKTAYETRISDWSSDVCSSDLTGQDLIIAGDYIAQGLRHRASELATEWLGPRTEREIQQTMRREVEQEIGSASCRERVCQYV